MAKAIPLVAAVAGSALAGPAGVGLLNAGIGLTAAQGLIAGQIVGFVVSTAVNQVGSRLLAKKPKAPSFEAEASGRSVVIRSSVDSRKIVYGTAKVSGPLVLAATTNSGPTIGGGKASGDNIFLHLVIPLAGHPVEAITTVYANDRPLPLDADGYVQTSPYSAAPTVNYLRVKKFLGAYDQAASPDLLAEVPGWTSAHRLRGVAYLYVRLQYSADAFPSGIPNFSAVVKGKNDVYDPRTGLSGWTDNAALCARDYLAAADAAGFPYGFGCDADEINDTYFTAAANVCDEGVALSTGGTQARYTCNGVVDTANPPLDNLQQILTACGGTVTYVQGKFRLHPAAYDAPAGTLTADMLAGPVGGEVRTGRKELFNAVKGTYVAPDRGWQPTDFPPVSNPTYRAEDNGERIEKDVQLPFTTHPEAAQRLGKVGLEKARQGIKFSAPLTHAAMRFAVFDTLAVDNAALGWSGKVFRVLSASTTGTGPVTLSLQEESSASYDWNNGEATAVDAAPDTTLPRPWEVSAPGALTVTESLYVTRAGDGVKAMAQLSWLPSPDAFLAQYQAEYKPQADAAWRPLPRTTDTRQDVEDIAPGAYDFRVKAVNTLGASSAYATASLPVSGLLAPPTAPQNLTISTIGGLAILRWDLAPDLDVRIGGKVVFRHSPDEADGWGQSTSIGNAVPGNGTVAVLPLKPGVYLAKTVDSTGIECTTAAGVVTEQATALAFANVTSLTEHPTFSGAKTGCFVTGGTLKLTAGGNFDAITDLDSVSDLDAFGGVNPSGSYAFSGGIDLGGVMPVRLTAHVRAAIDNQLDRVDDRTAATDDWLDFDGSVAAAADAVVYVRKTNDDPAGSPVWTAWQRLDSAEFLARAFEFELALTSTDPAYNVVVSELSVTADQVT